MVDVPCGSCRACCKRDLIILHPESGDVVASYLTTMTAHPLTGKLVPTLARKPNGECIYLGTDGCTIHDRAPVICREFDCRRLFLRLGRQGRKRLVRAGFGESDVLKAGRDRLHTLPPHERNAPQAPFRGLPEEQPI